ncbi:lysylphosphatidylglycerol synthase transmembrane domain-containing protein [Euzebya tangerina]|uniref:lysylphosphatidylglycerol synthase transmembrane domain-containing protein n=1 Tax=Euzebya tangerina TaxID=591198 RepID=UPI0013C2BE6C|nr:YbhN family protein [Euzebya tangerina]
MSSMGLAVYLVLPQLAGLRETGIAIAQASWWLAPLLGGLEGLALFAYGHMLHILITTGGQAVPESVVQRSTVMGYAIGRALPGGTGAAFALVVASFRNRGLDPVVTGTAMWATGLLSSVVLALMLPIAALLGLFSGHLGSIGVSAVVAAVGVIAIAVVVPIGLQDPEALGRRVRRLVTAVARGPLRNRLDPDSLADGATRGARNILELIRDRRTLSRVACWAAANWLLDAAVVAVLALTVGTGTPLTAVLLAYIVAQIVAALPLTPGGVGVVETAMVGAFVASGAPAAAATATVLGWRLVSHWLPIPIGLALMPEALRKSPL